MLPLCAPLVTAVLPRACPERSRRVVTVDVGDARRGTHGHPLAVGVVVSGGEALRATNRNLAVVANEHRRGGSHRLLDPLPITIVGEDGDRGAVGDGDQAAFHVISLGVGGAATDPLGLVAVGVVPVLLHPSQVSYGVGLGSWGNTARLAVAVACTGKVIYVADLVVGKALVVGACPPVGVAPQ